MKRLNFNGRAVSGGWLVACALGWLVISPPIFAADFSVTSPGYYYEINGQGPNPTLTLIRGHTYTFDVNTDPYHPIYITGDGVENNNIFSGTLTYTVPMEAGDHSYFCSIHGFGASIVTVGDAPPPPPPPPPPPTVQIVDVSVGTNIVLRSTGTNTWAVTPQYTTQLGGTNWFALTVLTNRFANGVNETICGRPPGDVFFIRVQATQNSQ